MSKVLHKSIESSRIALVFENSNDKAKLDLNLFNN